MGKVVSKIKEFMFSSKKRIIITIVALVLVSFGVGYLVLAEGDELKNAIDVRNATIEVIEDGTAPFDTEGGDGNDISKNNKIVRNFDSVGYTINYDLNINEEKTTELKAEGYESPSALRTVYVDVFIPKSLNATISQISSNGEQYNDISTSVGDYIHASYIFDEIDALASDSTVAQNNQFTFWIKNINSSSDTSIEPIILIYESTKETQTLNSDAFNIDEYKVGKTQVSISEENKVKVTGVVDYNLNLFAGPSERDSDGNRTFAVAMVLGIDNSTEKGIKGKYIPSEADFQLSFATGGYSGITNVEMADHDYTKDSGFTIDSGSTDFPYLNEMTDQKNNNGSIGIDNNWIVSISQIKYLEKNGSYFDNGAVNIKIVSAKVFKFKATRDVSNTADVKITVSAFTTDLQKELAKLELTDIYGGYVGSFSSSINLYNEVNDTIAEKPQTKGKAVYNYGDTMYIDSTMRYADTSGGESLTDFKNYIKVDNEALTILEYSDKENCKLDVNGETPEETEADVKYIYGSWVAENFNITADAKNYPSCPTTLIDLSKDELMNLYGGPCIELNTDSSDIISRETLLNEDLADKNIMIVETTLKNIVPSSKVNMRLKAKVKDDSNLVGNAYQVVTNSTAQYNDVTYYLSDTINTNDTGVMSDKNNYIKTVYDFVSRKEESSHVISNSAISGNTILVSGVKVNAPDVRSLYKDSELLAFNNFPIEWEISSQAVKNSSNSYESAEVVVYLPQYLTFTTASLNNQPLNPTIGEEIMDSVKYTTLTFKILPENIIDDTISFQFFTDRAFNTPSKIEQEVLVKSNFYVTNLNDSSKPYSDILSDDMRTTSHKITIYNSSDILTSGIVNPYLIEKGKSYDYTVKSFNNGSSSKMSLLYVLPYNGDMLDEEKGSVVTGSLDVKMSSLPTGYKAYYTKNDPKTIFGNELNDSSVPGSNEWQEWTNYTVDISGITAIKIVADTVQTSQYFATENGITFTVTPKSNAIGDEYYNRFIMIATDSNNQLIDYVSSSFSVASVYNRKVSGFVFEDSDYDGLYSSSLESTMADIPVEIYKLSATDIKADSNILDLISDTDVKVSDTVTDSQGKYSFRGLDVGYYYVKYTFNCEKYTATDKGKKSESLSNSETINSNANMLSNSCAAVSDVIEINNIDKTEVKNINLGLAVRKNFGVNLKKYITNVVVNSNKGIESYDYDNETHVKIDVKNLKNTSFRVTYKFEIENSKYFPGYVGFIGESIPSGMTFDASLKENDGWVEYGGALYYTKLSDTLIMPGEKHYFTIVLDLKTETAGDFVNLVVASNFSVLGENPYQLNFDDLNVESGETSTDTSENEQESQEIGE